MKRTVAFIFLILVMLLWATNFHIVKIALEYYSALGVASWRFFFAAITLLLIVGIQYRSKLKDIRFSKKEWWHIFLTSFFGIFLTIYFFNEGLKTTSAINGSLIIATSPAITALFSFLLMRKRILPLQWLAICISFIGVVLILVKGDLQLLLQLQFVVGDLFILGMAFVFSLSQIIVTKYLTHVDATVLTTLSSIIALLLFVLFSIPELQTTAIPTDKYFWMSILFMGILSTGFAYTAFYYCVVQLGPTISTLYMNLIPFFTVILAVPFGEEIYSTQLIGGSVVIAGLLLYNFSKREIAEVGSA